MTGVAGRLALAFAMLLCRPAWAAPYQVGPWSVEIEPNRAVAALEDPFGFWTLFVRCVEGHLDLLVRRHAAPLAEQASIEHYAGTLRVDGGADLSFPAQTWSLDGFLAPDADAMLPAIEAGHHLDFTFVDDAGHRGMSFFAVATQEALRPVRQRCEAPAS